MKNRIRHIFPHHLGVQTDEHVPRGWINPQGRFMKTKEHWASINSHFRRPDTRSADSKEAPEEAETAERTAHLAYSHGWISVGHAGKLNAVGHQRTFATMNHPAVMALRQLLAHLSDHAIPIETQIGNYVPSRGLHDDFEMKEYDLAFLVKRGRLREIR